jgi:NarL family two-component system response regulator LiaR
VLIVDDHPLLRRGLRDALAFFPEFAIVGEASSGEEAVRLFTQTRPDIVLMDLVLSGGMPGVDAIRTILAIAPDARILVVSNYTDGEQVQEALRAGALGYQLKSAELEQLIKAIRHVASGALTLDPTAARSLAQTTRTGRGTLGQDLTDRELEVLTLLARGLSNQDIAKQLIITVATVKFHLRSIRSKLGTTTRTETVMVALQHHLIHLR